MKTLDNKSIAHQMSNPEAFVDKHGFAYGVPDAYSGKTYTEIQKFPVIVEMTSYSEEDNFVKVNPSVTSFIETNADVKISAESVDQGTYCRDFDLVGSSIQNFPLEVPEHVSFRTYFAYTGTDYTNPLGTLPIPIFMGSQVLHPKIKELEPENPRSVKNGYYYSLKDTMLKGASSVEACILAHFYDRVPTANGSRISIYASLSDEPSFTSADTLLFSTGNTASDDSNAGDSVLTALSTYSSFYITHLRDSATNVFSYQDVCIRFNMTSPGSTVFGTSIANTQSINLFHLKKLQTRNSWRRMRFVSMSALLTNNTAALTAGGNIGATVVTNASPQVPVYEDTASRPGAYDGNLKDGAYVFWYPPSETSYKSWRSMDADVNNDLMDDNSIVISWKANPGAPQVLRLRCYVIMQIETISQLDNGKAVSYASQEEDLRWFIAYCPIKVAMQNDVHDVYTKLMSSGSSLVKKGGKWAFQKMVDNKEQILATVVNGAIKALPLLMTLV